MTAWGAPQPLKGADVCTAHFMSTLSLVRDKIYKTVARQLHGAVPCWVCGEHVEHADATLEHIQPRSEGGNSHVENLAISHDACNNRRHARPKA